MFRNKKLSHCKIAKVVDCFCLDICATKTSQLVGINRNTTNRYFTVFRKLIFAFQCAEKERLINEVEADKSSIWQSQTDGMAGSRPSGHNIIKPPLIIGIYERNGRVFTEFVPPHAATLLYSFIHGRISSDHICDADDAWFRYDGLVDLGCNKHYGIGKGGRFTPQSACNGRIGSFWDFARQRFSKLKGIKKNFDLHLKECEWRYNKSAEQLNNELQKLISFVQVMTVKASGTRSQYPFEPKSMA